MTVTLMFTFVFCCFGQPGEFEPRTAKQGVDRQDPRAKSVWYGKQQIGERAESELVPIALGDLPGGARGDLGREVCNIVNWIRREALPFRGDLCEEASPTLEIRAYAARTADEIDLIDLRWKVGADPIRIVISRNAVRFDFGLSGSSPNAGSLARAEVVARLKSRVEAAFPLRNDVGDDWQRYDIHIPWEQAIVDGFEFSSNPEQILEAMGYWWTRVDAYCENGVFSIFMYRKIPQKTTFRDGSKWFPDDFRQLVIEKAAEAKPAP